MRLLLLVTYLASVTFLSSQPCEAFLSRRSNVPTTNSPRTTFSKITLCPDDNVETTTTKTTPTPVPPSSSSCSSSSSLGYALRKRNPYDVHVYYADDAQRDEALRLREKMSRRFSSWMRFYEPKSAPLGPHPVPMWEADFAAYENRHRLTEVCDFLKKERGTLSVLIHPHSTDGDFADHTRHAMWFGETLPLRIRKRNEKRRSDAD